MAERFLIAGADRKASILLDSISIEQVLTSAIDTMSFETKNFQPNEGDEIIIEVDDLGRLFGGIIDTVHLKRNVRGINFYSVEAMDYTYKLDARLVVETYENKSADFIVRDLIHKYTDGTFTTNNVQSGAPYIEYMVLDYLRLSEAIKQICEYVGWDWYVDYFKDIHFFRPQDLNNKAPMDIEEGKEFRDLTFKIDTKGLRNRVYVRGGSMKSDPFEYEVVADGKERIWNLPHKPHGLKMYVDNVPVSVGIEYIDNEMEFAYLLNFQEKYVRASVHTPTVVNGATIRWNYQHDIDVITMVEDIGSQEAVKAIQGGDGIYEHVINDNSLVSLDSAESAGTEDLRQHANPKIKGTFKTDVAGWKAGQIVNINLPQRGISNEYIIQKVTTYPLTPELWEFQIEFGGRLIGIPDFMKAIVSKEQKKKQAEVSLLHKFIYKPDSAVIRDSVDLRYSEFPLKVEQSFKPVVRDRNLTKIETSSVDFNTGDNRNTGGWEDTLAITASNLVPNAGFTSVSGGWLVDWTRSHTTNVTLEGGRIKHVSNATHRGADASSARFSIDPLKPLTVSAFAEVTSITKGAFYLSTYFYNASGTYLTHIDFMSSSTVKGRTRYSQTWQPNQLPAGTAQVHVRGTFWNSTGDSEGIAFTDSYQVEQGGFLTPFSAGKLLEGYRQVSYDVASVGKYGSSSINWTDTAMDGYFGTGGEISIPSHNSIEVVGDMTIEFEIVPFNVGSDRLNPVGKAYGGEFFLTLELDGQMSYYHGSAGNNANPYIGREVFAVGTFKNNQKYHVAIVRSMLDGSIKSYLNGELHRTSFWDTSTEPNPLASSLPLRIFKGYTETNMTAHMANVRLWNIARTANQIKENAFKKITSAQTGLVFNAILDAQSGVNWTATTPTVTGVSHIKTDIKVETSINNGVTWQHTTNGGAVNPNYVWGSSLTGQSILVRQTLTSTNSAVSPLLHDMTLFFDSFADLEFETVGSLLNIWQESSETQARVYVSMSSDAANWSEWITVDPHLIKPLKVPYEQGFIRIKTNKEIFAYNRKDSADTIVIVGSVQM